MRAFLAVFILCCIQNSALRIAWTPSTTPSKTSQWRGQGLGRLSAMTSSSTYPELERALLREYSTFFAPMERRFYEDDVSFVDPLTSFTGIDKYQNNVDMLAGRSTLGRLLFKDASIALHKVTTVAPNKIQTRWTLQFTIKFLPWQPRPRFTGVSIYTINAATGKVQGQEDYWDAINLSRGEYKAVPFSQGLQYFLAGLSGDQTAEMAAPELPFELLRRAASYEIRRYPEILTAETLYDQRPEGYDRLGSYAGGSNVLDVRIPYFTPTLMFISDNEAKRVKRMTWPVAFDSPINPLPELSFLPEPTIPRVTLHRRPGKVYAVGSFQLPATEVNCRTFFSYLLRDIQADGLKPTQAAIDGEIIVGQFDALFSLNKRRVEVWAEVEDDGGAWSR